VQLQGVLPDEDPIEPAPDLATDRLDRRVADEVQVQLRPHLTDPLTQKLDPVDECALGDPVQVHPRQEVPDVVQVER
jgi:hypothetical protein